MSGTTDRNNAVLVADDDERLLAGLKRAIRGYHVFTAATPASALAIFESTRIDAAVVDLDLGRARGDDLVAQLRKRSPWLAIVVLTGVGSAELGALAIRAGADVVIDKPVLPPRLVEIVNEVRARPRSVSLVDARDAYIAKVIEDCDGNKSEAARRLKIERYSLRRMLSKAKRTGP